jgi:CRISPR/Cas system CSM-associated protein Csm3 (group 7 of RAMP superfamily)
MTDKVYVRLTLETKSPFSVCSGLDEHSDKDIIRHSNNNKPFIPGSTLAGIIREYIHRSEADVSGKTGESACDRFFGYIGTGGKKGEHNARQSRIIFADAELSDECMISLRDGVKLDGRKTAVNMGKYNYEIIEPGTTFESIIEYSGEDTKSFIEIIKKAAAAINSGEIRIGSKTNRGLGYMKAKGLIKRFTKGNALEWLDFDPYSFDWSSAEGKIDEAKEFNGMVIDLEIPSTIIVRDYNTEPAIAEGNIENLDSGHLHSALGPVIPGTTWSGAFRHRAQVILEEELGINAEKVGSFIETAFGQEVTSRKAAESNLSFFESVIERSTIIPITRTKIDRFTGGSLRGALFSENICCNGKTTLQIGIKHSCRNKEAVAGLILLCLEDLNDGLLAVGGETAAGRGIIKVINKKLPADMTEESCLKSLAEELNN